MHHGSGALAEPAAGEDVSVTPCLALIAETGTAVVSARLSGRSPAGSRRTRARDRGPDWTSWCRHLAAALELVGPELVRSSSVTLVTGPSRTGDIEQLPIQGVHGPGQVHVVFV